jgi:hypothetical protein
MPSSTRPLTPPHDRLPETFRQPFEEQHMTIPLTNEQLNEYAVLAETAAHIGENVSPRVVTELVAEVRRIQGQRRYLIDQIAKKDAASGRGDEALRAFLAGEQPAEPTRRLEDGSTHTVQALTDAGESCVQQECRAAREEERLRQEQYTLRAAVEGVLDEVGYMADDERVTAEAGGELRRLLRDVLGLDRQLS